MIISKEKVEDTKILHGILECMVVALKHYEKTRDQFFLEKYKDFDKAKKIISERIESSDYSVREAKRRSADEFVIDFCNKRIDENGLSTGHYQKTIDSITL